MGWGIMDWIDMAENRDGWRAVVNAVMNLRVLYNAVNFLPSWGFVTSQEGLCSLELVS
jgi:hypothetical protein